MFLYPRDIINLLPVSKTLYKTNQIINWKKLFKILFSNSPTYIDFPCNSNAVMNLAKPNCYECNTLTTSFHIKKMDRICLDCYNKDEENKDEENKDIVPIIGQWFFKSMPDFIISDNIKPGKYKNYTVTPDIWQAVNDAKFGSVICIMKDIIIKEKFIDRQFIFKIPVRLYGAKNKQTGNFYKISLPQSSICFRQSSIIENLIIISGPEKYGPYNPIDPENAYPCLQIDNFQNKQNNSIIQNCIITARVGTGILINKPNIVANIHNNTITECSYAGICLVKSISHLTYITNNNIIDNGSWAVQTKIQKDADNIMIMNHCTNNELIIR